jgi:hypothetical protein
MKIHVLTPFWRKDLIPTLIHHLEKHNIEWYPIIAPNEQIDLEKESLSELFNREWIHPVVVPNIDMAKEPLGSFRKFNDFLDTQEIIDSDYYCFMSDDDGYEPGFFDVIRKQIAKIIMCSMYRGNHLPTADKTCASHSTCPLFMRNFEDIRFCHVGQEQFIIKGEIFKKHRWCTPNTRNAPADGAYAIELKEKYKDEILFLPNLFVFFNYFQPRRYNKRAGKRRPLLKSTWEYPTII